MVNRSTVSGLVACLLICLLTCSCVILAQQAQFTAGVRTGRIDSTRLREVSGLAVSRRNEDVIWVHNDSGDGPLIYAVNPKGKVLAAFSVTGARAVDWEDIAIGPGPEPNEDYLYIADTGDNRARRSSVVIYRVREPIVDPNARAANGRTLPADAIQVIWPDGPKDVEAIFVDPLTRDIYLISKRELFSHLYCLRYPQSLKAINQAKPLMVLPLGLVTAADISCDGTLVVVRTMIHAYLWRKEPDQPVSAAFRGRAWRLPLQPEPQGEAIGLDRKGQAYYTISEGQSPAVYRFELMTEE